MATYEELRQRVLYAAGDVAAAQKRVGAEGPRAPEVVKEELHRRWASGLLTYPKATGGAMSCDRDAALTSAVRVFNIRHCTTHVSNAYLTDLRLWDEAKAALAYYLAHEPPLTAPWQQQADWVVNIFYWCQLAILATNISWVFVNTGQQSFFQGIKTAIDAWLERVREESMRHFGITPAAHADEGRRLELRRRQLHVRGGFQVGTFNVPTHARDRGLICFEVCKRLYTDLDLTPVPHPAGGRHVWWRSRIAVCEARSGLADADWSEYGRPSIGPAEFPQVVAAQINGAETYDKWGEALKRMLSFDFRTNIRTVFMTYANRTLVSERDATAIAVPYLNKLAGIDVSVPTVTVSTPVGLREQAKLYAAAVLGADLGRELQSLLAWYTGTYLTDYAIKGKIDIPPEELSAAANAISRANFSAVGNVIGAIGSTLSSALPPAALVTTIVAGLYNVWGGLFSGGYVDVPQPLFMRRVPSCEAWAREAAAQSLVPIPLESTPILIPDVHDPNEAAGMSTTGKVALGVLGAAGALLLYKALTR